MDDARQADGPPISPIAQLGLFKATVEAVLDAVVVTGPALDAPGPTIEYVNPACTAMTGYSAEEVLGRTPRFLQGPGTDRNVLDRMRADLAAQRRFSGRAVNYKKNGEAYLVEWLISAVLDTDGEVAHWVAVQRDVTNREQMHANEVLLAAELKHRVRNVLSVVQALVRKSRKNSHTQDDYVAKLEGRLGALARTQLLLTSAANAGGDLTSLVVGELEAQAIDRARYSIDGPEILLSPKAVEALSMIVHELVINAVEFGAFSDAPGAVAISWRIEGEHQPPRVRLEWSETGDAGATIIPQQKGFGWELIERQASMGAGGQGKLVFHPDGVQCTIDLPLVQRPSILETGLPSLFEEGAYRREHVAG